MTIERETSAIIERGASAKLKVPDPSVPGPGKVKVNGVWGPRYIPENARTYLNADGKCYMWVFDAE